jgi:WD40 repeat protein
MALGAGPPDVIWENMGHTRSVNGVAYSADGALVASGADHGDSTARLWYAADGAFLKEFAGHSDGVISVDLSSDGNYLAVGFIQSGYPPGGVVKVWDVIFETQVHQFGGCHVAFSPDGAYLASGGGGVNRYLSVHRLSDGARLVSEYTGSYVTDVAFSPDGTIVATGGSDNTVKLWNSTSGALLHTLSGHTDDVAALAFSPDGTLVASGAGGFDVPNDSTIKLWRTSDGGLVGTVSGHDVWVYSIDFAPDGAHLISSGRDGVSPNNYSSIRIWRVADGTLLQTYDQGTQYGVLEVRFSPDGRRYVYGRGGGEVAVAGNPFGPPPGDFNGDGNVSLEDHAGFAACIGGPGNDPVAGNGIPSHMCLEAFDFDTDDDIDLRDWADLQSIMREKVSG